MARYYDAELGRFISRDVFPGFEEEPQSQHRYSYAENNPVGNVDPTGLAVHKKTIFVTFQMHDFAGLNLIYVNSTVWFKYDGRYVVGFGASSYPGIGLFALPDWALTGWISYNIGTVPSRSITHVARGTFEWPWPLPYYKASLTNRIGVNYYGGYKVRRGHRGDLVYRGYLYRPNPIVTQNY